MAAKDSNVGVHQAAFSDRSVVLCRPDDSSLAKLWEEAGGFEQHESGPVMVVIGALTSDDKCASLGQRFGVEPSRLIKFRDTPTLRRVVVVDAEMRP